MFEGYIMNLKTVNNIVQSFWIYSRFSTCFSLHTASAFLDKTNPQRTPPSCRDCLCRC